MNKIFPFLNWTYELKDPAILRADMIAGLTVALVLIPQSMAYATLAAVIIVAVFGLVNFKSVKHIRVANKHDGIAAMGIFFATIRQLVSKPVPV